MLKLRCFLLFSLLIVCSGVSQNKYVDEMYDLLHVANRSYIDSLGNINYLKPLDVLIQNKKRFQHIDRNAFRNYIDVLNTSYSYVHAEDSIASNLDRVYISEEFEVFDPIPLLKENIGDTRVVMLNEAHHVPNHRLFAESLLETLQNKNFNYLAVETLYWSDTLINHRKYPISTTGYYSKEPYFANFIRSAIKKGFTIIPYEQKEGSGEINEREINQANNLIRVIKQDSTAKIFVYAGYSHIKEKSDFEGVTWMAERFKDSTGIDPFTIDQTSFKTNYGSAKPVLINLTESNDTLTKPYKDMFDVSVMHSEEIKNQHITLGRKEYQVFLNEDIISDNNLYLLQAYVVSEYNESGNKAIPFDQRLVSTKADKITLQLLPKEDYFMMVKDVSGKTLIKKQIRLRNKKIKL